MSPIWGILSALASAVANGSFGVFAKLKPVREAEVSSPLFNFWVSMGVVLESLCVYFAYGRFTSWGILGGFLFVLSTANTFFAIQHIGLAIASATWSGTAVLVSFGFGLWSGDKLAHPVMALLAIVGILAAIAGIAYANWSSERLRNRILDSDVNDDENGLILEHQSLREEGLCGGPSGRGQPNADVVKGFAAAVAAGVFGGLILAPMSWAPEEHRGLAFLVGMGLGGFIGILPVTASLLALSGEGMPNSVQMTISAVFGTLSGLVWGFGNAASIIAVSSGAGLSVAYPIMQAGLFVAGLWGIFLFQELHPRAQPAYWASGAVLVGATVLLIISK